MWADSLKRVAADAMIGCGLALALVTAAMLVASAVVPDAVQPVTDRVGRGIVAAAAVGVVVFAVLYGYLATGARLALATFYADLPPRTRQLRDTLIVRGQANPAPYEPASASTITLGSIALLAALPCVVLAVEHADRLDDELHQAAFVQWAVWAGGFVVLTVVCAVVVRVLSVRSRRWVADVGARVPDGALGDRGPVARITTRAQRRVQRRSWQALEWWAWTGRVVVGLGAGLVFLGVYLRQPGLYADQISYSSGVERTIDLGTVVGGTLLVLGFLVVLVTGARTLIRTVDALRREGTDPRSAAGSDLTQVRAATRTLSDTASVLLIWWTVCSAAALGWWFSTQVQTPADGTAAVAPLPLPVTPAVSLTVWVVLGVLIMGARVVLESVGPTVRNRFGHQIPSEPDDREYPNLTLFGQ
ncbi:hypothetical protein D1871_07880 [Nakamurella silvestris]|nr:hypothetical protein D1871_07880 [Nakamurella silvestris]